MSGQILGAIIAILITLICMLAISFLEERRLKKICEEDNIIRARENKRISDILTDEKFKRLELEELIKQEGYEITDLSKQYYYKLVKEEEK